MNFIETIYWKIRYWFEDKAKVRHVKNVSNKYIPFYDKKSKIYRVFFKDRWDEEGSIDYVVSEYIESSLIYHFYINNGRTHEHSFDAVLSVITHYKASGFSIAEEDKHEYSDQEYAMLYKYATKLQQDNKVMMVER